MRLFVAVRPPDDVLGAVERAVAPARRAVVGPRWTTPDQWHLTLQFLGRVEDDDVGDVSRALEPLSKVQPFPVRLGGGGAFPRVSRARVVWLGLVGGGEGMAELARAVNTALAPLGFDRRFDPGDREHHPHLTLARLKVAGDVGPAVEALGDGPVGGAFLVGEVVLYRSRPSRAGSRYDPVAAVPLEG